MSTQQPVPGIPGATMRRVAFVPSILPDAVDVGPQIMAKPGHLLLVHPETGAFLVRDGRTIEFAHDDDADPGAISLVLHGTARGALIHQRGELPLHAATLVPPGGEVALAICGRSGAGKSTLAMELSRRGWLLVADDTTRVTWNGATPMAWPSRDSIKLWRDACEAAGIDTAAQTRVMRGLDKFYVQVPSRGEPVPLGTIIELTGPRASEDISIGDKMALVSRHTYRPLQIRPLGVQKEHFAIVARVAASCAMRQFRGSRSMPVRDLADVVETMVR